MEIKIKQASIKDFDVLMMFRILLLKFDSELDKKMPYNPEKILKSASYMKDYLKRNDNKYFIAYHNSIPVGYLHVTFDDKKDKANSYLSEVYVLDTFRGKDIGERLVYAQWKYLKKRKITKNSLTTAKYKNKYAIDFYKRLGYELIKEDKKENFVYFSLNLP